MYSVKPDSYSYLYVAHLVHSTDDFSCVRTRVNVHTSTQDASKIDGNSIALLEEWRRCRKELQLLYSVRTARTVRKRCAYSLVRLRTVWKYEPAFSIPYKTVYTQYTRIVCNCVWKKIFLQVL